MERQDFFLFTDERSLIDSHETDSRYLLLVTCIISPVAGSLVPAEVF